MQKVRPRRTLRRWLFFGALGALLGTLAVLWLSWIYNPFATSIESPLVLVPGKADFVLNVTQFPDVVDGMRERPFSRALKNHEGFQQFRETKDARDTGVVEALQKAFASLDELRTSLPLGLELLPGVSGAHVVVCGYLPDRTDARKEAPRFSNRPVESEDVRFMAVFRPESWKAVAGVNVLRNERLFDLFMRDSLEAEGIRVEHGRNLVRLQLPASSKGAAPSELFITRIGDTVLVGTEERELERIFKFVETKGIPASAANRYAGMEVPNDRYPVQLLFKRESLDRYVKMEETLTGLWGEDTFELAESVIPTLGGEDMLVEMGLGRDLRMALQGPLGPPATGSLSTILRPFSAVDLREEFYRLEDLLPQSVFALLHLNSGLGELCDVLLKRPDIFSAEDRKDLRQALGRVQGLGGLDGALATLTEATDSRLSLAFFTQDRDGLEDQAQVGYALVAPVRDMERMKRTMTLIEQDVRRRRGEGLIKEIYREQRGDASLYKPVLVAGSVDDPRVTVPGIGLIGGYLVITNYHPFLMEVGEVVSGGAPGMGGGGFESALSFAPRGVLLACLMDGERMQPYLIQSATGWAYQQTEVTQMKFAEWRRVAGRRAIDQGMTRGSPEYARWVDGEVRRLESALVKVDRPQRRKKILDHIRYFDGFLDGLGFFVAHEVSRVRMSLRLSVAKPGK